MTYVSAGSIAAARGGRHDLLGQSLAGAFWPIVFQAGITEFVGGPCWVRVVRWRDDPGAGAIFLRPPPQPLHVEGWR